MAYIENKNSWENHLRYSVIFSPDNDEWRKIAYLPDLGFSPPVIRSNVVEWLEEHIGETKESIWHKDKFHPSKPKWHYEVSERGHYTENYYCTVKFLFEEDALAFKLRWV